MTVTRQLASFLRISTDDRIQLMHSIACLLDTGAGRELI